MYFLWELFYVFVLPIIIVVLFNLSLVNVLFNRERLSKKWLIVNVVLLVLCGTYVFVMVFSFVSITGVFMYDHYKYMFWFWRIAMNRKKNCVIFATAILYIIVPVGWMEFLTGISRWMDGYSFFRWNSNLVKVWNSYQNDFCMTMKI